MQLLQLMVRLYLCIGIFGSLSPSLAQKLPPREELTALKRFADANAHLSSNKRNFQGWSVSFDALGNWIGGNPCHGFKGVRCWSTGNIRMLYLPLCKLNDTISPSLGNLSLLTRLTLGHNELSGDMAAALSTLVNLRTLILERNRLTGFVPALVRDMFRLEELTLAGNSLQGRIPSGTFANFTALQAFDISQNFISGTIPEDLVRLPSLRSLVLSDNNITGRFPASLASSPSLSLNVVNVSGNFLHGALPLVWATPNLTSLDLSRNNLSGIVPPQLLNITTLQMLNLSRNGFVGNVSMALSARFGCSAFAGNVGLVMEDSNCSLTLLQQSAPPTEPSGYNSSGDVPVLPQQSEGDHRKKKGLSTLAIVALTAGDIFLFLMCIVGFAIFWIWWKKRDHESSKVGAGGSDSDESTKRPSTHTSPTKDWYSHLNNNSMKSSAAPPALRPALKSVVGTAPDPDNESEYTTAAEGSVDDSLVYSIEDFGTDIVILDSTLSLEFEDLLRANAVVLGGGTIGCVYMASLEDGQMLAIKRLEQAALANERVFGKQCARLADVLHPNLLQLRAYCWSPQEKLLIFDYMANGNVHFHLHNGSPKLQGKGMDWPIRLKIAVGTARALAHLHDSDMVHGCVKATNVLLDGHFEPRVSDFGLEALLQAPLQHTPKSGYVPPELGISTLHGTQAGDVYSFGVFLLELLTGLESVGKNGLELGAWVHDMTSTNRTVEVFDPALVSMHVLPAQDVLEFLELAQACVSKDARARPSITIVLRRLESIVPGSTAPRSLTQENDRDP